MSWYKVHAVSVSVTTVQTAIVTSTATTKKQSVSLVVVQVVVLCNLIKFVGAMIPVSEIEKS